MTQEQKTKISEHFDEFNVSDDLKAVLRACYLAGAGYALDMFAPHWISVEDELPPRFSLDPSESMNVLTYGLRTIVSSYYYDKDVWAGNTEVTHWMPLPQAPTIAKNATVKEKGGKP